MYKNEQMIKLADVYQQKNGKKKIKFFELGLYDLLKVKLGFRYTKINGKGYYLKENNGIYEISYFHHLGDSFRKFIEEEFENLEISKEIDFKDFMEEYYKKGPIRNGNYARDYLSEDFVLSPENLNLILLKIDPNYSRRTKRQEMLLFLKSEGFTESIDKIGNFCKNCPIHYKRIADDTFLIFNNPFQDEKHDSTNFDFWKIRSYSERDFLAKTTTNQTLIIPGFHLDRDIELYGKEKVSVNKV